MLWPCRRFLGPGWWTGAVDMLSWLSQRLDMEYAWGPAADSAWGNAVLTRYPILHSENHEMPNNEDFPLDRAFLWVEIDVGEEAPLRVIATHFHHVRDESEHRIPQTEAVLGFWGGVSQTVLLGRPERNTRGPRNQDARRGRPPRLIRGCRGDGPRVHVPVRWPNQAHRLCLDQPRPEIHELLLYRESGLGPFAGRSYY